MIPEDVLFRDSAHDSNFLFRAAHPPGTPQDYEEGFEQIILEHPPPEDYNVMEEDRNAPKEDKKKDKKGYRVFPT
jgi:hypothetical protein